MFKRKKIFLRVREKKRTTWKSKKCKKNIEKYKLSGIQVKHENGRSDEGFHSCFFFFYLFTCIYYKCKDKTDTGSGYYSWRHCFELKLFKQTIYFFNNDWLEKTN